MATRNVLIILFLGRLSQGHCPCWLSVLTIRVDYSCLL